MNVDTRVHYTQNVYKFSLAGDLQEYKIDLGEQYLYDMEMSINDKGQLEGNGFYTDKRKLFRLNGLYHFTINTETLSIIDDKRMPLQKEFSDKLIEPRELYTNEKDKWYNKKKLDDLTNIGYYIVKSLLQKDGSRIIIGEQRVSNDPPPDTDSYEYNYHYSSGFGRIVILELNPKGEIIDLKYIDREIESRTTQKNLTKLQRHAMGCSVFAFQKGDDLFFIYMHRLYSIFKLLSIAKLSSDGTITKQELPNDVKKTPEFAISLIIPNIVVVNDNTLITTHMDLYYRRSLVKIELLD